MSDTDRVSKHMISRVKVIVLLITDTIYIENVVDEIS
jgi:hypothetical protein